MKKANKRLVTSIASWVAAAYLNPVTDLLYLVLHGYPCSGNHLGEGKLLFYIKAAPQIKGIVNKQQGSCTNHISTERMKQGDACTAAFSSANEQ